MRQVVVADCEVGRECAGRDLAAVVAVAYPSTHEPWRSSRKFKLHGAAEASRAGGGGCAEPVGSYPGQWEGPAGFGVCALCLGCHRRFGFLLVPYELSTIWYVALDSVFEILMLDFAQCKTCCFLLCLRSSDIPKSLTF